MSESGNVRNVSRRDALEAMGSAAVVSVVLPPILGGVPGHPSSFMTSRAALDAWAGPDRIVVRPGATFLNGWAGYGERPRRRRHRRDEAQPTPEIGPMPSVRWSKTTGPGEVAFADPTALTTTATFSEYGTYVLRLTAVDGGSQVTSTFTVKVERPPPAQALDPVSTKRYRIDNRLWGQRTKALIVSWIPHCIEQINRTDLERGAGGIDNFLEAAKALAGEPHGPHKGYVFSNAWVYQTIESMSNALMIDPQNDPDILAAHALMRETLDDWIPKILAAREPDGYLHTAFTLRDRTRWRERWSAEGRRNHEGYVAGYFLEAAIQHYEMTGRRDARLFDAATRLADCWYDHIGPPPKQEWFDGHQGMEQALVRFGRFVNELDGARAGDKYLDLAKFLLDCRRDGYEYDQSHLPVVQQYEAVGHAVRAMYNYSGMADVAIETRNVDYQSAVRSLWDNVVNKKYYATGGVGSGETAEGFGEDYSLPNDAYCESCSSCGAISFQSKLNRMYHDARYADLYEETLYNALLGSMDLTGEHFYYTNPLDANAPRAAWHNVPCCTGNIPRTLLMLPTWMYARGAEGVYINLFVGSTVTVENVAGTDVELVQATEYPWDGRVSITVNPRRPTRFAIRIRVPNRSVSALYQSTRDADGITSMTVNETAVEPAIEQGYAVLMRTWAAGDTIALELPLRVQRVRADPKIEPDRGRVALRYGPLIYNIEQQDQSITGTLPPDTALTTEWREELLDGVMVIRGRFADGAEMTAIPNYARYNRAAAESPPRDRRRGPPTSIVWIREGS